jgi:uncharacterized damage-inducible protein DinB
MLREIHRLFEHVEWADSRLLSALQGPPAASAEVIREYAHILGAGEVWLARLEGRPSRVAVWPELTLGELPALGKRVRSGYESYLGSLDESVLSRTVAYTTSAGEPFENSVRDILLHVALHAQYHRGKVNWLLRESGLDPSPADYIAFVRDVPAATTREGVPAAAERGMRP